MRDFTVTIFTQLVVSLKQNGYAFQTFRDYLKCPLDRVVILRHDVDKKPINALRFAEIESQHDIQASYFFRIKKGSYDPLIIKKINCLNHEIGYHYEDMDSCNGDIDEAYGSFVVNLENLRCLVPIDTICMHGSPLSRYDNRDLWDKYCYREHDIIGEPYLDQDFTKIFYMTDTGRRWNNKDVSIRDKVLTPFDIAIKTTQDIITMANQGKLPEKIMINTHPQRWNDNLIYWAVELILQSIKNKVKATVINTRLKR